MSDNIASPPAVDPGSRRSLWIGYASACGVAWLLYVLAGAEFQRALWQLWQAVYQATLALWPPMILGVGVFPWVLRMQDGRGAALREVALHGVGALVFGAAWQACDYAVSGLLYGHVFANVNLEQTVLWRAIWGVIAYAAIATAFTAWLQARRARAASLAAAHAESALARAELAVISGKLNPHFLFNTLNSLIALTRKDAQAAEAALMRFSSMLRYVLDTKRSAADRVPLGEEIEFVRDYLALESLRLGKRLRVDWELDPETMADEIPPLSLQPLVENAIQHGIAPRVDGGRVGIRSARNVLNQGLELSVEDDGAGCEPATLDDPAPARSGIGLTALRRRFALDYDGQARLQIRTQPGAGFRVDLWIPQP
ncbi:MAG: histidine kinase [Burkholderiales bacterium]|nr:histidine kinase [Burkholderiales bacterium]